MFHVTTTNCRRCNAMYVGQRVMCVSCMTLPDTPQFLLDRARIATAMYSDMVEQLTAGDLERWGVVLDAAAAIEQLPPMKQLSAAIQFRKRLDLTAKTPDLFGIITALYIQYMEHCTDVDLYARLLWTVDHQRAAEFDKVREQ